MLKLINFTLIFLTPFFLTLSIHAQQNSAVIDSLIARGDSLLNDRDFKAARAAFNAILKINHNHLQAYAGLGKIAIAMEKWGEAKEQFGKILNKDPDNLEAHYYRGICYRETGKFKALLLRKLDWDKSKKHFQMVILKDSLYQDVLYQFARLLRYQEKYTQAIRMGHTQVRLRPELVEPQVRLFRFYRYFTTHEQQEEVITWLKHQPWDQARYFIGEKLRRDAVVNQADSIFQELLTQPLSMSKQPIYLSLARIYYGKNLPGMAEKYYWQAVDEIKNQIDADLVFEDVKYIVTDQELETYRSNNSIQGKIEFFRIIWTRRDPIPAATINFRLAEHFRRLLYAEQNYEYDGFRTLFNNPDKFGYLEFTKGYGLNNEFNDKGLIYIRHGPPDDRAITVAENVISNESWLYYKNQTNPEMTFHFVLENTASLWRFTPIISDPEMLNDRLYWGGIYYKLLRASPIERLSYVQEMAKENRQYVETGLSTDRQTWDKEIKPLEIPFATATFRGDQGKTILEVYTAISLSTLAREIEDDKRTIELEKGLTIHDLDWQPIERKQEKLSLLAQKDKIFIDSYRFTVRPDSYNVALYARPLGTNLLGGYKFPKRIVDYSLHGLTMSEIQMASYIEPSVTDNKFVKNGLLVMPNPTHAYSHNKPVNIYFEIYNLTQDSNGNTAFTIEYTLILLKQRLRGLKKLLSLFGGSKSSITLSTDREGNAEFSVEYLSIDVSRVESGDYNIVVKVTDKHTGKTVERTRKINLF